jgi:hypothetical protein
MEELRSRIGFSISSESIGVESKRWRFQIRRTEDEQEPPKHSAIRFDRCGLEAASTQSPAEKMKLGPDYANLDLVFTTELGTPISSVNLRNRHFKPIMKEPDYRR